MFSSQTKLSSEVFKPFEDSSPADDWAVAADEAKPLARIFGRNGREARRGQASADQRSAFTVGLFSALR